MKRKGITLTEALVALFIAALGMISLLTLFPLGAMQMGQALKDSRTAQAAQEADGLLRWYWTKYETNPSAQTPILLALDRADYTAATSWLNGTEESPSYPVLIDPQGYPNITAWPNPNQNRRVGNIQSFARRTPSEPQFNATGSLTGYQDLLRAPRLRENIERFTVLQDELDYGEQNMGAPASGANKVQRGAQYSWSWLVQRPKNSRRGLVNVQVVVYFKRSPFYANAETERTFTNVTMIPGSTKVQVNYSGVKPEVLKGRWIMDSTLTAGSTPLRHAIFYRVVSVNDETAGQLHLELETPIRRNDTGTANDTSGSKNYNGTLVVFNRVAEVFDRPPLITGDNQK